MGLLINKVLVDGNWNDKLFHLKVQFKINFFSDMKWKKNQ